MNTDISFSEYYENTLSSIDESEKAIEDIEHGKACPIRSNYEEFSYSREGNIAAHAMAVRRCTPEETAKMMLKASKPRWRTKKQPSDASLDGDAQSATPLKAPQPLRVVAKVQVNLDGDHSLLGDRKHS